MPETTSATSSEATQKIQPVSFRITWTEASRQDWPEVSTWEEIDAQLSAIRSEIEAGAGYCNKTGFEIVFADGETYTGRYDVIRRETPNLYRHVSGFVGAMSGLVRPPHMSQSSFEEHRRVYGIETEAAFYFLAREYAVGVETPEDRPPKEGPMPDALLSADLLAFLQTVEETHPDAGIASEAASLAGRLLNETK